MGKLLAQIRYRAKALWTAAGLIVVGVAEYVVVAPDTTKAVQSVLPLPWNQLVPLALAGIATAIVHEWPNAPKPGEFGALTPQQAAAIEALVTEHLGRVAAAQHVAAATDSPMPAIITQTPASEPDALTGMVKLVTPPSR